MKILVIDTQRYHVTTRAVWEYWQKHEVHEVLVNHHFSANQVEWADLVWVEWCGRNAHELSKQKWDNTKVIIRCVDIDCYTAGAENVNWDNVDEMLFISHHTKEMVVNRGRVPFASDAEVIPLGIGPDQWEFRERDASGRHVAYVGRFWSLKGSVLCPDILYELQKVDKLYHLTMLGPFAGDKKMEWHFLQYAFKELGLMDSVKMVQRVPDMNEFFDDVDFLFNPSYKEAFSLVTAEAACKGIKPVIRNWWGAKENWPDEWIFNTQNEAIEMILSPDYRSKDYRDYVVETWPASKEIAAVDNLIERLFA